MPDILSGLILVQTVCKGYQQMTEVAASWQRVKYRTTSGNFFLAKTLAKANFIWLQIFPFGKVLHGYMGTTNSEPG